MKLQDISQRKNELLDQLTILADSPLAPFGGESTKTITKSDILAKKEALAKGDFIVAFTGQIKAGKSTLINALLFRKPLLPSEITVMTAKNTLVKYGEQPSFIAEFYSESAWQTMLSGLKRHGDKSVYENFQKEVEASSNDGFTPTRWITAAGKKEKSTSLEDLVKYIGPYHHGGVYTPYVKSITIFYPNPMLKDVIFADTPGVNDPNPYRDRITKDWVTNASAVVHTMYAGRAFDQSDKDFIQDFLLHVPSAQRIIAINKVDTIDDPNAIHTWLDDMRQQDSRNRHLLGDKDGIINVSGMGALIDEMKEDGAAFDDVFEEWAELIEDSGFDNAERHNMPALESLITRKLLDNKAEALFTNAEQFIVAALQYDLRHLDNEFAIEQERLNALASDIDVIELKIRELKEAGRQIGKHSEDLETSAQKIVDEVYHQFKRSFDDLKIDALQKAQTKIDSYQTIHELITQSPWDIKTIMESSALEIHQILRELQEKTQSELADQFHDFVHNTKLKELGISSIDTLIRLTHRNAESRLSELFSQVFTSVEVERVANDSLNWIQKGLKFLTVETTSARKNAKTAVLKSAKNALEKAFKQRAVEIHVHYNQGVGKILSQQINEVKRGVLKLQADLEKIQENRDKKEQYKAGVDTRLNELTTRRAALTELCNKLGLQADVF